MLTALLLVAAGLVGLFLGGEALVRGAVGIAQRAGISSLVTGLVIVGAATSMPELVTSVGAALSGSPQIAWGNIIGSNIANTLLILGAAALVTPIVLKGSGTRDAASALAATLVLWLLAVLDYGAVWIGLALLATLGAYIYWRLRHPRPGLAVEEAEGEAPALPKSILFFAIGVGVLIAGGQSLVTGAIDLARLFGVSETVIGLTIVAIGTSLPELAASVAAAWRGQAGMAFGNVVGSNIFNLLLIGGTTMTLAPLPVPGEVADFEMAVLTGTAVLLLLLCRFAGSVSRLLGAAMLAAFGAVNVLLFL